MAQMYDAKVGDRVFCWLGTKPLPAHLDLRQQGWELVPHRDKMKRSDRAIWLIDHADYLAETKGTAGTVPVWTCNKALIVTDVQSTADRADLLRAGVGEAIPDCISLEELDARAILLTEAVHSLPRYRQIGSLRLDLLAREAFSDDLPLNLNPREFALLWRLSENIDRPVSKQSLVHDVWRMGFVPETNSIAVHMSRLRRKLGHVGIKGLIETVPTGGYSLRSCDAFARRKAPMNGLARRNQSEVANGPVLG